jgi:hypothetical protein
VLTRRQCVLYSQVLNEPVAVSRIVALLDKSTGAVLNPGKRIKCVVCLVASFVTYRVRMQMRGRGRYGDR